MNEANQDNQKVIHYQLNDEPQETMERQLTPNQIMSGAKPTAIDPTQNYLEQIKGRDKISYQNEGTKPIDMHDGMKFITVFTGTVPVSFDSGKGREEFERQLLELGYSPDAKEGGSKATFNYVPPGGRFKGQTIKLGFDVPADFPRTPPSGPHVSPALLPMNPRAPNHPDRTAASGPFGDGWQYWSRPFPNWREKVGVVGYMAYVDHLFETT